METRTIERTVETSGYESDSAPLYSIRWAAVIAGLAVGLGVHLVLLLAGLAAGLAVLGSGERPDGTSLSLAAAIWNAFSLLFAALVGGYIAARSSGLRRAADGVLHAVAAWGASMVCYLFLVSALTGNTVAGLLGVTTATARMNIGVSASSNATMTDLLSALERGDRDSAARLMRERFGLNPDEADRAADRALAMVGGTRAGAPAEKVNEAARTVSAASAWMSLVILLSLAAGAGGGLLGARGTRERAVPSYRRNRHIVHHRRGEGLADAR